MKWSSIHACENVTCKKKWRDGDNDSKEYLMIIDIDKDRGMELSLGSLALHKSLWINPEECKVQEKVEKDEENKVEFNTCL